MVESGEMIERWTHVERVLAAMPEHERQNHWNMGTWGEMNECGTIACAAGHCGLDPWFRERGFTLDFSDGEYEISSVEKFFGTEGSSRIFLNTTNRPVETVIGEVRSFIGEMRNLHALATAPGLPRLGEEWPDQGGVFAGARLGLNGAPNYFLIVGPECEDYAEWGRAVSWATSLVVGAHTDFNLPDLSEHCALFDRVRSLFKAEAYWSSEQHASLSGCAWGQGFRYGHQHYWGKGYGLRARAVRRVPIQ